MWKIQLILEPVGNGGPAAGGKDGVWEKGDGGSIRWSGQRNLFGKSQIEPTGKFRAGAKCEG